EAGTLVSLLPGAYGVTESGGPATGYFAGTFSAECSGVIAAGEQKSCTVTNDAQPAHLTVLKTVINDSGGTKREPDFTMHVRRAAITVPIGVNVTDDAMLLGVAPSAGGTITYKVYSDTTCTTLIFDATPAPNSVTNGSAPASEPFSSSGAGVFYWQAVYSGDAN